LKAALLHRSTVLNIHGESYRLKEKRQTSPSLAGSSPQGGEP
jgi:hypothetical protein